MNLKFLIGLLLGFGIGFGCCRQFTAQAHPEQLARRADDIDAAISALEPVGLGRAQALQIDRVISARLSRTSPGRAAWSASGAAGSTWSHSMATAEASAPARRT